MATATTNKLPEFATEPQDNTFDEEIIDKSSELEETGFVPNTTIRSSQMNTYMKMMIESLRGIVDGLYRQAAAQGEIKANSTAQEWQNYIQKGLTDLITKTKVNNTTHADEATNVDAITNNDSGNNANVKFSIGDQSFSKTVNNVANANACSGNAASATKLQTSRTINISGDATGTAQSFDGTANITIPVDVKKSAALDSTNIGDATHPVYFDANGKPVEVNQKIANDTSGKADTAGTADEAIKLQTSRTISLTGDATGSISFDGSANASITVDVKTSAALDSKNIGSSTLPVYFDATGKPIACSYFLGSTIRPVYHNATAILENAFIPTTYTDATSTERPISYMAAQIGNPTGALNVGDTSNPVYFSNGIPIVCSNITANATAMTLISTTGSYSSGWTLSDTSNFLGLVVAGYGAETSTAIAMFNYGRPTSPFTIIVPFTASSSADTVTTMIYSFTYSTSPNMLVVTNYALYGDGHIATGTGYNCSTLRIYKIMNIG